VSAPASNRTCEPTHEPRYLRHGPDRPARPQPLPARRVGPGRNRLLRRRHGPHRDPVRGRQRLPGPPRQRGRGPGRPCARHLHQRVPRNLAHPSRRRGLRVRPGRPDHRQRPGCEDHPDLRRRRAAGAHPRRTAQLRAPARLRRRHPLPLAGLAHPVRQAGPDPLSPPGLVHRSSSPVRPSTGRTASASTTGPSPARPTTGTPAAPKPSPTGCCSHASNAPTTAGTSSVSGAPTRA
jgi:hypothetical protein